jgi:hypothetical protein
MRDLRHAGVGASAGLTVAIGGVATAINPVLSVNGGPNGSDELWLVVPRASVLSTRCVPGSAVTVTNVPSSGPLGVSCTTPALQTTDTAIISNFRTGVLVSGLTFPSATSLSYAQQGISGMTSSPVRGNQVGDLIYPVDIVRYRVAQQPNGNWTLVKSRGALNPGGPFPFVEVEQIATYNDIEDLQVSFGRGTPLTFTNTLPVQFDASRPPVVARISLVGISPLPVRDDANRLLPLRPVSLEDRVASTNIDGFRRSVLRRRVELVNMNLNAL